ncbi:hypothetical protein [Polyangium jinanense]|uniref:Uncharacterized protein n=1 Tax=Polyangium jinanense TaxID=2829994 RepID=A0A9X3XI38_9BACT|nr:hypothetical protein [Polyangium jinanense]MDC3962770.1 hypothetical protein [Polyangium jinanense]MDC3989503.1 hypothetical protein [Polyangium jinanense]
MANHPSPAKLSRVEKATISRKLQQKLVERAQFGPAEPALDIFIPQLDAFALRLESHVLGKKAAHAALVAHGDKVEITDEGVDTWARHIESFLAIEGRRRHSIFASAARVLSTAAFPEGLAFLDDRIPDENARMRATLTVLRAPEHASTLVGIKLPPEWIDSLESALDASDQAYADRVHAHGTQVEHVYKGQSAEAEWVHLVGRLKKYVESRDIPGDADRKMENRALLAPLTDAIAHAKAVAATRATRRTKKA